ncbi:MAG: hypothetical protein ABIQ64_00790 [Candidatus Saccharimonadales bacterium]
MSEISEPTRREAKQQQELLRQDRQIAHKVGRRVLRKVDSVGQEIPATGRWGRGTTTERALNIAEDDLAEQGVFTTVEMRDDALTSSEHRQHKADKPFPYPVFVITELIDKRSLPHQE